MINTCCITSEAEAKSRQSVRRSLRAGGQQVIVSGCAVELERRGSSPRSTTGSGRWSAPPRTWARRGRPRGSEAGPGCIEHQRDLDTPAGLSATRTRGFVKVQDGCDCHCSYCIIPKVRGAARSRGSSGGARRGPAPRCPGPARDGDDRNLGRRLPRPGAAGLELGELMQEVAEVDGVERVRLSSVEVIHVRDTLLDALSQERPRLSAPAHPDAVRRRQRAARDGPPLRLCRRVPATRSARCARRCPHVNVTTDVIVGFPTEDEDAFERTLRGGRRRRHHPRARVLVLAAAGDGRRGARRPRRRPRRRSAARASCAAARRSAPATIAPRKLGGGERVLIDKVADTQCSGYTADYTRCYLPAGAGRARARSSTCECVELHADGIACWIRRTSAGLS